MQNRRQLGKDTLAVPITAFKQSQKSCGWKGHGDVIHPAYCSKQGSFQNYVLQQRGMHLLTLDYRLKWDGKKEIGMRAVCLQNQLQCVLVKAYQ